jgi:hypothetical protein
VIYLNIRHELSYINRQDKNIKYDNDFDKIIEIDGKKAFMSLLFILKIIFSNLKNNTKI